ncbi:NlpC/P60 family protein [Streptomyces sp. NPDC051555]|uniref:C40 family peptidase n=1 Tax=Streptomyces sp. NPDC051555 TaxID=3365657 RepID=UPI0037A732D9
MSHPAPSPHRKPRTRLRPSTPAAAAGRLGVVTTAAVAALGLLPQQLVLAAPAAPAAPAVPAPRPSVEEVRSRVDALQRQAGTATQEYDAAAERVAVQRAKLVALMDQVAHNTQRLNETRRLLGSLAAAQYRGAGPLGDAAALLLGSDPQGFFAQEHLMSRLGDRGERLLADARQQQLDTSKRRAEAAGALSEVESSQAELRQRKKAVQGRLAEANALLTGLTRAERTRLAELEAGAGAEAPGGPLPADAPPSAHGARAVAFARAQLGKPYVWGATGPGSYDCSGLTQAAWRAAGIDLPRTTWDQVQAGPRIATADLRPGDLVFFYDDISHVGLYIGGGRMIHAPRPGAYVREDSIHYQPMYGSVRPG